MRNHPLFRLLALVLVSCTVARAGDATVLEQLQDETRALTEAANRALVRFNGAYWFGDTVQYDDQLATSSGAWLSLGPVVKDGKLYVTPSVLAPVYGVLVGSPAKLVVPHEAGTPTRQAVALLADSTTVQVTLIDADAELGVAVYGLPPDVAAKWHGLEVASRWEDVAPGTLALDAGGRLGLTVVQEADPAVGELEVDTARQQGTPTMLVGARRRLLGLARLPRPGYARDATAAAARTALDGLVLQYAPRPTSYTIYAPTAALPGTHVAGPVIARVLDDIEKHGEIRHTYLGVVLGGIEGKGADAGVAVSQVLPDSPAAKAELAAGARILCVDDVRVVSPARLSRMLIVKRPGEQVVLTWRGPAADAATTKTTVTLGDRAEAQDTFVDEETLGLTCMDLGPELRRFMGLADEDAGVVVKDVRADGAAYRAGLRRGDLIVWGGGAAVADLEELRAVLASAKGSVVLKWRRPGNASPIGATVAIPGTKRAPR